MEQGTKSALSALPPSEKPQLNEGKIDHPPAEESDFRGFCRSMIEWLLIGLPSLGVGLAVLFWYKGEVKSANDFTWWEMFCVHGFASGVLEIYRAFRSPR
ncbi:hypothetical protein WHR41_02515 [Cladosporium halotolerans]|uniref:Uncharacterized protein n=1 Tax=Cladosporium halotolerans TaxID=1052096 RepID=A0AB34KZB9_9PEZI